MGTLFKVILTIVIILIIGLTFIIAIAVGASSHNISNSARFLFLGLFIVTLLLGVIGIVVTWFGLNRIIQRKKSE